MPGNGSTCLGKHLSPQNTKSSCIVKEKYCEKHATVMRRNKENELGNIAILLITIHCTHYQNSDWPRAPCLF